MPQKFKSLLGSARTRYFKEAKSTPVKFRPQKVRFRKRYASSMLARWTSRMWTFVKTVITVGVLGGLIYQGQAFWKTSPWLKVSAIQFLGNPPEGLSAFLSIKPGQNIFTINAQELENAALSQFKELKSVSIVRHLSREVSVEVAYRRPLAVLGSGAKKMGVDGDGTLFPIADAPAPLQSGPELTGFSQGAELRRTMEGLSTASSQAPDFYSLIKILKTDRMQPLRIVLQNDVLIYWGEMNSLTVVGRAKKVLHVLQSFEPKKPLASLRFVTDERLVMDSQWQAKN